MNEPGIDSSNNQSFAESWLDNRDRIFRDEREIGSAILTRIGIETGLVGRHYSRNIPTGMAMGGWTRYGSEDAHPHEPSQQHRPWWGVLGVPQIATRDEIARAYKRRISEYHPDKVAHLGEEIRAVAERRSKETNAAYDEAMRRA